MRKIRDSYSAQVWLEGSAVAFLDSRYPDDELSVQIARFISDGMKRTRKQQASASPCTSPSIQVLRAVPDVVEDKATTQRILDLEAQNNELRRAVLQISDQLTQSLPPLPQMSELTAPPAHPNRMVPEPDRTESESEPEAKPKSKPSRGLIGSNAIGQLQEIAQQAKVKLPFYEPKGSDPNFECLCRFKFLGEHHVAKGRGSSKKAAKVDAAVEMLRVLGYTFT
ncbi:MAG: hypothetical protein DCF25_18290 [Leptolyngbya foveolarum]|uniref:DRBM domain-containing protein n=1 Tax=Leptolyngbya foveolarum TaxID=47253 RepID=A0A2W4TSZ4_9CYAN|nr:MAG: hypothetical protein DCF25_18290 [Leptolyngbya foveolarum]